MTDQTKSDSVEKIADTLRGIVGQRAGVLSMSLVADLQLIESRLRALPTSATAQAAVACSTCDDTGDVHRADGEWLGVCPCPAGDRHRFRPTSVAAREAAGWWRWSDMDGRIHITKDLPSVDECHPGSIPVPFGDAPPPQPVSETAVQGSVEFGKALDELIRANTAEDADDRFGIERERRARAAVESLFAGVAKDAKRWNVSRRLYDSDYQQGIDALIARDAARSAETGLTYGREKRNLQCGHDSLQEF